MKYGKLLIGFAALVLYTSCELAPFEEGTNPVNPEQTTIQEETTMFVSNVQNENFIFETNDTNYLNTNGYTLWTVPNVNSNDNFKPISVEVTKESGRSEAGYGIVFCEQKIENKPFMLTVLINTNGYYAIGKLSNGIFSHINDGWKSSSYIFRGIGAKNTISVTYDNSSKNFMLKINGYEITSFTVSEQFVFKNSRSGYVVVIANNESFPTKPVRVIYENK